MQYIQFPDQGTLGTVYLKLVPGNVTAGFELQRARQSATGTYETVMMYPGNYIPAAGLLYIDSLPLDGSVYYYRGRHVGEPRSEGPWSTPIRVDPFYSAFINDGTPSIDFGDDTNTNTPTIGGGGSRDDTTLF